MERFGEKITPNLIVWTAKQREKKMEAENELNESFVTNDFVWMTT